METSSNEKKRNGLTVDSPKVRNPKFHLSKITTLMGAVSSNGDYLNGYVGFPLFTRTCYHLIIRYLIMWTLSVSMHSRHLPVTGFLSMDKNKTDFTHREKVFLFQIKLSFSFFLQGEKEN